MKINSKAVYAFVKVEFDSKPTLISGSSIREATIKKNVCLQSGHVCGPIRKVPYPVGKYGNI